MFLHFSWRLSALPCFWFFFLKKHGTAKRRKQINGEGGERHGKGKLLLPPPHHHCGLLFLVSREVWPPSWPTYHLYKQGGGEWAKWAAAVSSISIISLFPSLLLLPEKEVTGLAEAATIVITSLPNLKVILLRLYNCKIKYLTRQ